jgi:hypothetical protein
MANKEINYKQYRILDFDPDICGVEDGYIVLFSPYKLIIDGVLIVPDGIRMPDGSVINDIRYDATSFFWNMFSSESASNEHKFGRLCSQFEKISIKSSLF